MIPLRALKKTCVSSIAPEQTCVPNILIRFQECVRILPTWDSKLPELVQKNIQNLNQKPFLFDSTARPVVSHIMSSLRRNHVFCRIFSATPSHHHAFLCRSIQCHKELQELHVTEVSKLSCWAEIYRRFSLLCPTKKMGFNSTRVDVTQIQWAKMRSYPTQNE